MKIHATFIGVNRHQDALVPELTGASRDAKALWALLEDTIPGVDAQLLVDEQATRAAVAHSLERTLTEADPTDVVIFSFSGHGSHDHRLVMHDTDCSRLSDTTISMGDLAEKFKASKARAILCILDCCFSGAAPAKVLENSPIPRLAGSPFDLIAGKGRVLIAASSPTESAWEQPGTGHGLLTKAIIDVLTDGEAEEISLIAAIDEIANRTRTEAVRIGVVQSPVFINQVEGGLSFPRLKPGKNFYAEFPDFDGRVLKGPIEELEALGIPTKVLEFWNAKYPNGLNELQLSAMNDFHVLRGESLLAVAPTSSGKTFIGELAAIKSASQGKKAIYLFPYKALADEKFRDFRAAYEPAGLRVARCTGDFSDQASVIMSGRYDIGLLTYEMFLGLAVSAPSVLAQAGIIVLDEGQFITDPNRGIIVELLLTLIIRARERGINPQLIVLSAVIGNVNFFDEWLGCQKLVTTKRPVPLVEGVLDRTGTFQYLDENGTSHTEQLLGRGEIQQRGRSTSSQDVIVPLVKKLVGNKEKVLIFRNRKGPAEGCAEYLARDLGLAPVKDAIAKLPTHDVSTSTVRLRSCFEGATAFHNTNLGAPERAVVEEYFRKTDGGIEVLVSTTTLAAGINTPASTVILVEHQFVGEETKDFTVAEYKNMVGRAGRLGFNEKGKSILLADGAMERGQLFSKYVLGAPEPVRSSFTSKSLATWVLRLFSQVKHLPKGEVPKLLANTYGGFLQARTNPDWVNRISIEISAVLLRMTENGLLEEEGNDLRLTLLGNACGRSSLSFDSSLRLVEILRRQDMSTLQGDDLVLLIQVLAECDDLYAPMQKGSAESARVTEASSRYRADLVSLLRSFTSEQMTFWARCKKAAIMKDWMLGVPVDEIERRYSTSAFQSINFGHIRSFADGTRYHLRSAQQIIAALVPDPTNLLKELDRVILSLEIGLPENCFDFMLLPISPSRGEILALKQLGVSTSEQIRTLDYKVLAGIVGDVRATSLKGLER